MWPRSASGRNRICLALAAAVFFGAALAAPASEWQWSVPDGQARAYLWIPPDCERVRAVMVGNHNMLEQNLLQHPEMRRTLAEFGIAEVWVAPKLEMPFDFNKGAGEHFDRVMDALAKESGYDELRSVPVIPVGHSACATFPWNFAAWNPARTLAVLSLKGDAPRTDRTGYGGPNVEWGTRTIDGVPGLMVMGEYEWGEERLAPAFRFVREHPGTPLAFVADAGGGHFDCSDELVTLLTMFLRKAALARLPKEPSRELVPVRPEAGWLMDRWRKDQPPAAPAAPFADYAGNRSEAFWCFDEEMARAIEKHYARERGKKPQALTVASEDVPLGKAAGEPVTPRFLPMADGLTFKLRADFAGEVSTNGNSARWACLPAGSPLGHADGPIRLTTIVGPVKQLAPDTFAYSPGRAEAVENPRNLDLWILASQPGDGVYKRAVQQAKVRAMPDERGASQTIDFPAIADQPADARPIKLRATSSADLPVAFFVREGPAEIAGDELSFTAIPPRAKYPVKVTVVAWQFGRPGVAAAQPVKRTFHILPGKSL